MEKIRKKILMFYIKTFKPNGHQNIKLKEDIKMTAALTRMKQRQFLYLAKIDP